MSNYLPRPEEMAESIFFAQDQSRLRNAVRTQITKPKIYKKIVDLLTNELAVQVEHNSEWALRMIISECQENIMNSELRNLENDI